MKKFNSIFAVASVVLTSVFGFTSCQKDPLPVQNNKTEDTKQETKEESKVNKYYGFQMFVNDEALALGDIVVVVNSDGKTTEYKASESQTASVNSKDFISVSDKTAMEVFNIKEGKYSKEVYTGKKLVVPNFYVKSDVSFEIKFVPNEAALSALDMDGKTDVVLTYTYGYSPKNNFALDATDLKSLSREMNGEIKINGNKYTNSNLKNVRIADYLNSRSKSITNLIK